MHIQTKNFDFSFNELEITVEQVEEAMGYPRGESPEPFPDMISTALLQSADLIHIKGSLIISDDFITDQAGTIIVEGVTFQVGKKIVRQLRNAESGALFICTAGVGIGDKSKDLIASGDLLEGYILDVIGSLTVEAAMDKIQNSLEIELKRTGKKITNSYSPGTCGWALHEQKQFFELFPDNYCGITLSDSYLMEPTKSVSGVIGFGINLRKSAFECEICELKSCSFRTKRLAKVRQKS